MTEQAPKKRRRRREGYLHKSPAICIVVHDMHGKPIPDAVAAQILNLVTEVALANQFLINFTRT